MAKDSILRLRVESQEYDAKLKKAAEGIRHLAEVAHRGGGELTGLEKAEVDYIKSLGEMETKSKTAAGSTRELENAFKELTFIYNQLSDVEKADEGGKALAASLETLKQRTIDAKSQMDAVTQSLQTNESEGQKDSSMLSKLAERFTVNIDALKLFDMGLKAANVALDVAKDAFFASEASVDEWGRTMQAAQSLYDGFLTSLNNSDFSGFLSRIDEIVQAARTAYDELDRLGTMKTIQAPAMSKQEAENQRMRTMLMTGRWISAGDGRKSNNGLNDGDILSQAQLKAIERQLQNGMQNIVKLVGNEVKQTGKAIDAYYNSLAKQNGMTMAEFRKGTSSMAEFDKMQAGYRNYQKWRQENSFTDAWGNTRYREGNPYQEFQKWGTFRVDKMGENSYNDLVALIRQQQQQQSQMYSTMGQAYRTINRAEGLTVKDIMKGGTGGAGGGTTGGGHTTMTTTSIEDKMAQMWERAFMKSVSTSDSFVNPNESETSEIWKALSQESEVALSPLQKLREELAYLTKSLDEAADPQAYQDIKKVIEGKQRQIDEFTGEDPKRNKGTDKTADELAKIGGDISKVTNSVGSIFSGLQQMGIEIPNEIQSVIGVVNGISTILIGISTLLTLIDAKQDVQTFASIIPFYARGGVVPHAATGYFVGGNRRSGDTTHIMANAGELVLNESSQNSLAADILQARGLIESVNMLYGIGNPMLSMQTQSALGGQLRDGGLSTLKLEAYVKGEQLHLVHNRFLRRSGQGEIVTWK